MVVELWVSVFEPVESTTCRLMMMLVCSGSSFRVAGAEVIVTLFCCGKSTSCTVGIH